MTARFERAGVVGGGIMGSRIASVCARAGVDVVLVEADVARADAARDRIVRSLELAVRRGKTELADAGAALARLTTTGAMASEAAGLLGRKTRRALYSYD